MKRILVPLLFLIGGFVSLYLVLKSNVCTVEHAWERNSNGGVVQTCKCKGKQLEVKNDLPVDGDRVTICVGIIEK